MHQAELYRALGINRLDRLRDRLWKSFETIHITDEDILQSAILQLRQDLQPELGSLPG